MTATLTPSERVAAVRDLAEELIAEHLTGWRFEFDRAVKRAGACHYQRRTITISRPLAERWDVADMRNTILHEIAHALTPGAHHGPEWRRTARAIGCDGSRTHVGEVATERMRWAGTCPNGHSVHRARRPRGVSGCARCSRTFNPRYIIEWSVNPAWDGVR